ncbi:hypothetical protein R4M03_05345 [Brachyspira pilosicoli]|uniref:Uncharacterized protein n=5 Tax=Brachyspira pilosicoli TaxID=52584 RepID=D8IAK9_BRAP9|nr:hypothetical protein [Brachyspira pilosicoli]ADK30190.1 conserved hypothetical protein [Brachyspira pilosicoli 95/1000]AFR70815.1 hypothetical protein B2904_orf1480 [Brachyspira pilosicoli B2904]AGA65760.1 hypothetical protein BPP43_02160 [Brachyspira pilosicoli P43/6/78]MBW5378102.1 hypothetical protein [Brachyspira pilosicoli]MBW5381899.1 hypothetical protein [Brachyspira pilosicoli]
MEYNDKETILELQEDNKLLASKIDIYKEEINELKQKLEYAQKFFVLYENIMEQSRSETKDLTNKVKELEAEIKRLKNA